MRILFKCFLSDRAFETHLQQFLGFDGELHRQFVHDLFGVAVDDESDGIFDTDTALLAVEELVLVDLGDGRLVLDGGGGVGDDHIGESVCPAFIAQQQTVTLAVVTRILCVHAHLNQSAICVLAMSGGDTFGDNTRACILADMDHLGAGVGLLVVIGDGDGVELRGGVIATQDTGRIFPGDGGTGLNLGPGEACVLERDTAFGDEIINSALAVFITRIPVLDGGVLDFRILKDDDLDDGCMELVLISHGGGAALQIGQISPLVGNEERALELTGVAGIDAEISAELHRAADTLRHIDEGTVGEDGGVERRIEIIGRGHDRAKIFLDQFGVLAHCFGNGAEDDPFLGEGVAERGLDRDGIHDRIDRHVACERCPFLEGDTEFVEGLHDLFVNLVFLSLLFLGLRCRVIGDCLKIDLGDSEVRPGGRDHGLPFAEGFESELKEPFGFVLLGRDEPNDILVQSGRHDIGLHVGGEAVFIVLRGYVLDDLFQPPLFRAAWRPVAESNRSKRFCRPLTKSLIQPAGACIRTSRDSRPRRSITPSFCATLFGRNFVTLYSSRDINPIKTGVLIGEEEVRRLYESRGDEVVVSHFRLESGCKITTNFSNTQIFPYFFAKKD